MGFLPNREQREMVKSVFPNSFLRGWFYLRLFSEQIEDGAKGLGGAQAKKNIGQFVLKFGKLTDGQKTDLISGFGLEPDYGFRSDVISDSRPRIVHPDIRGSRR